jgi:hypothetical protein
MISTDQKQASRDNGKKSHGPKTPEGKAVSSLNAVKYGFFARDPLLPGEDADAFHKFSAPLLASLTPAGDVEHMLANRIVDAAWRLRRFPRIEAEILTSQMWKDVAKQSWSYALELSHTGLDPRDTPASKRDVFREAIQLEKDASRASVSPDTSIGRAFIRDSKGEGALTRLSRYEAIIERGLYRGLHELQRLQAARAGMAVPPPIALDVDMDVIHEVILQNEPGNAASPEPLAA